MKPCIHNWVTLEKVILPSAYEQIESDGSPMRLDGNTTSIFQKKIIIVLTCDKCGILEKIIEKNPE
jgi:hypothetical protein